MVVVTMGVIGIGGRTEDPFSVDLRRVRSDVVWDDLKAQTVTGSGKHLEYKTSPTSVSCAVGLGRYCWTCLVP
jgi:hypothetical protein